MQFLQNNIWMIGVALGSGLMLLWSFVGNSVRGIKEVSSVDALQLINHKSALILDVREEKEFNSGHLLNAKWIPLGKLAGNLAKLDRHRDKPLVVYCRSGQRSAAACVLLGKQGFSQAHKLAGGVLAWQKSGLPLEK